MYGIYDKEGILRFINTDKEACLAYAELFELSSTNYSLMHLPEPKIAQIIKGEKETTRANGHMTKKKFSEMRIKLGKNGKTETGQDAAAVETEPKAERI